MSKETETLEEGKARHKSDTLDHISRDFGMMAPYQRNLMGEFYDKALAESSGLLLTAAFGTAARRVVAFALPDLVSAYLKSPAEEKPAEAPEPTPPPGDAVKPADNPAGDIQSSAAPAPAGRFAALAARASEPNAFEDAARGRGE